MSIDIVRYSTIEDKYSIGSNCVPGAPASPACGNVPNGDIYILIELGCFGEYICFKPETTEILFLYETPFGIEEGCTLGVWWKQYKTKEQFSVLRKYTDKLLQDFIYGPTEEF